MANKSHLQDVKAILEEVKELQDDDNEPDEGQIRDWVGQICEAYIELAERLVAIAPGDLQRVFYSDTGAAATEIALKMAFQGHMQAGETTRTRFAYIESSYHGDTLGAVSVGGIDIFHERFRPLLFDAIKLPFMFTKETCRPSATWPLTIPETDALNVLWADAWPGF